MDLSGIWKFRIGDRTEWKKRNYDDGDWGEIFVPGRWEDQNYPEYDGFAWYRTTFELSDDLKEETLYLNLGRIDDVDETYLNGYLIGSKGSFHPEYETAWDQTRTYFR